tara:strand:- start:173 stop:670 length:498 start_codon:yes stop_codon:yes gene_type:complete
MKQLINALLLILLILSQSYIIQANTTNSATNVSGSVSPINSLTAISYISSPSKKSHVITYEFSNNNPNGYDIHIRANSAALAVTITQEDSHEGFWGTDSITFVNSSSSNTFQQFTAHVPTVTKATYKARFSVTVVSDSPLSAHDISKLLTFNVQNYGNTFIALAH